MHVSALTSLCSVPRRGPPLVQDQQQRAVGDDGRGGRVFRGLHPLHQHFPLPQVREGSHQQGTHVRSHVRVLWDFPPRGHCPLRGRRVTLVFGCHAVFLLPSCRSRFALVRKSFFFFFLQFL